MNKKFLIVAMSVFVLLLVPTTPIFAEPVFDKIEIDNSSEEKSSTSTEFNYCLVSIGGDDSSVTPDKLFVFRKHVSYNYVIGSTKIYEIFKGKFYQFGFEFEVGELYNFTGLIFTKESSFWLIGYAKTVIVN